MTRERLRRLRPADLDDEQRELRTAMAAGIAPGIPPIVRDDGTLAGPFGLMLHTPRTGRALHRVSVALNRDGVLPDRIREIVILTVAAELGGGYPWFAHVTPARLAGVTDAELRRLLGRRETPTDPAAAAAVLLARSIVREPAVPEGLLERAETALGPQGLSELVVLAGFYRLVAQWLAAMGVSEPVTPSG